MRVRHIRKRQQETLAQFIHKRAARRALMASYNEDEQDDYEEGDYACTHCGGEGYREVEDPFWDDCDEFGYGPCTSCRGTGLRSQQWVF